MAQFLGMRESAQRMKRKTTSRASWTDWKRVDALKDKDIVIDRDSPLGIDAVLDRFRAQGPGCQSRMNALLRAYMEAHK
jgi:uncharacterized protein (DUF4415 family)